MKKNYAKILLSAAVVAGSFISAQAEELVVLDQKFDKLEAVTEAGVHKYGKNPWTGADAEGVEYQPNYNSIQNDGNVEDLEGWSSRTTYLYACQGFVRISKTNFGGDLVSPKFDALAGLESTDVTLSWQGIGYTSNQTLNDDGSYKSGLVHDYQWYGVAVLGPGTIEGATKTKTIAYLDGEGNSLNVDAAIIEIPTDCFITMDTLEAWGFEGTKQQLIIRGATAETQVAFMSTIPNVKTTDYTTEDMPIATDAPHGVNKKVNRVILDNIKVVATISSVSDIKTAEKAVKTRKVVENGQLYILVGDKKYNAMGIEMK
ncbi:MAG: hypothetical protein ACI4UN_04050 [Muribaculaceae bacterium]